MQPSQTSLDCWNQARIQQIESQVLTTKYTSSIYKNFFCKDIILFKRKLGVVPWVLRLDLDYYKAPPPFVDNNQMCSLICWSYCYWVQQLNSSCSFLTIQIITFSESFQIFIKNLFPCWFFLFHYRNLLLPPQVHLIFLCKFMGRFWNCIMS